MIIFDRGLSVRGLRTVRDKTFIDPENPPKSLTLAYLKEEHRALGANDALAVLETVAPGVDCGVVPITVAPAVARSSDAGILLDRPCAPAYRHLIDRLDRIDVRPREAAGV